jgi:hypothetical protein
MSLIGQPESYSDMLKRIFAATLAVGIICTFAVAWVSPEVRKFLDSWDAEAGIGILKGVKALYVLIPLLLAVLTRVFLVHDKVSDLLGLRRRFDIQDILKPLAEGVGFPTAGTRWLEVRTNRDLLMRRTFYPYASFKDPKIDGQLVRTSADRWAWFWCTIEPQVVLLITGIIFAVIAAWIHLVIVLSVMVILAVIALILWPQLKTGANAQVADILTREDWKTEIRAAFNDVLGGQNSAAQQGDAADRPGAGR